MALQQAAADKGFALVESKTPMRTGNRFVADNCVLGRFDFRAAEPHSPPSSSVSTRANQKFGPYQPMAITGQLMV